MWTLLFVHRLYKYNWLLSAMDQFADPWYTETQGYIKDGHALFFFEDVLFNIPKDILMIV